MQKFVHRLWFNKHHPLSWALLPLSWVFAAIALVRRWLYRYKLKKVYQASVPVIVVGNITAGGNGKTPMVLYLIELLKRHGINVGVVSRGYGADIKQAIVVGDIHDTSNVGDEPAMIYQRTSVPMVVSPNRVDAVKTLLSQFDVDVVICDDGLQHYALARDIELVIIDGTRRFGNSRLLPAGPLREGIWRLNQADMLVVNGASQDKNEYSMQLKCANLVPLVKPTTAIPKKGDSIIAMAAIGNPGRFFDSLREQGYILSKTHEFADHHHYVKSDFADFAPELPVIMTEKDAIKCMGFAQGSWWYLKVDAVLDKEFDEVLLDKLAQAKLKKEGMANGIR